MIDFHYLEQIKKDFDLEDIFIYNHNSGESFSLGHIPLSQDAVITTIQEFLGEMRKIESKEGCKGCIEFSELTACYFLLPQFPDYFFILLSKYNDINLHAIIYQIEDYLESL